MQATDDHDDIIAASSDYDAVIVGASLAGCATAMLLGRAGARVALVDKQPDPGAFKRVCSHFIQSSAVPTLERLGLLEPIAAAGGLRSRLRVWTRSGWIVPPADAVPAAVNLRRELLDPLVRASAAATPGVELLLGRRAERLVRDGERVSGVVVRDRDGEAVALHAPLVVGADGRDSHVAELAGVRERTVRHGRFAYGMYAEGAPAPFGADAAIWLLDPQWAGAFPTDGGLTFYAVMPTKDRLPAFRADPEAALRELFAGVADPPPLEGAQRVGPIIGKLEMPNRMRAPVGPGLALVGDAALATDPLWGVGCGWALQSAEWLADAVAPALTGKERLDAGLARYRKAYRRRLLPHAAMIHDYAGGRKHNPMERMLFAAAARDPRTATRFDAFGSRRTSPPRMLATTFPRVLAVNARHALGRRRARPARLAASA